MKPEGLTHENGRESLAMAVSATESANYYAAQKIIQ